MQAEAASSGVGHPMIPWVARLAALSVTLMLGIGLGTLGLGPARSTVPVESCIQAIGFARIEMGTSAAFALHMAQFLDAATVNSEDGMKVAIAQMDPLHVQTEAAVEGFIETARECERPAG